MRCLKCNNLVGEVTEYDSKALTEMAKQVIKDEARAAKVRAKYIGWKIRLGNGKIGLIAIGQRDDGYKFEVPEVLYY